MARPILYLTLGLSGAGKSYFSERLAKDIGAVYLNGDALRMAMIDEPVFSREEHRQVYRTMDFVVGELLRQGYSVIYNANFNKRAGRDEKREFAKRLHADCVLLWVNVPLSVAIERVKSREFEIPTDKQRRDPVVNLLALKRGLEEPRAEEPHIAIDGQLPYSQQFEQFKVGLEKLRL
jgi:predicted kinase